MVAGAKITKREFRQRCDGCARSTEPGWLWLGGGDWVQCPWCINGYVTGLETRIDPTRKIFLPGVVNG
jgi:hypothetical protein